MTQAELAEQVGITQTQVSRYEMGKALPRPATLRALAAAMGVTPEWLSHGEGEERQLLVKLSASKGEVDSGLSIHGDASTVSTFLKLAEGEGMTPDSFLAKLVYDHMEKLRAKNFNGLVDDSELAKLSMRVRELEARIGESSQTKSPKPKP